MRVVGGSARGRPLLQVPGSGTRPIMDRVKQSLFDVLRPRISGMAVLDLFAGSGSVGIEALSQGAGCCTFIDSSHKAVATIKRNLETTGFLDRSLVLHTDGLQYLKGTTETFDLIYIAPPQYKGLWTEALRLVSGQLRMASGPGGDEEEEMRRAWSSCRLIPGNTRASSWARSARCSRSDMGTRSWFFMSFRTRAVRRRGQVRLKAEHAESRGWHPGLYDDAPVGAGKRFRPGGNTVETFGPGQGGVGDPRPTPGVGTPGFMMTPRWGWEAVSSALLSSGFRAGFPGCQDFGLAVG